MEKKSRAQRLGEAANRIAGAVDDIECLREELEGWLENMPEDLQGGSKADELEEAITSLDFIIDTMREAVDEASSVEFPRAFS